MRMSWTATYMPTSLRGIANKSRRDRKARFTDLYRLLNEKNLRWCFYQLRRGAAAGVDGVTFKEYERDLDANLCRLVERLKVKKYRARLVRPRCCDGRAADEPTVGPHGILPVPKLFPE